MDKTPRKAWLGGGPMDQLGAARDTFRRALAAVRSGDYSRMGAFQQEVSQYLQLGRGVYASGQGYADIYAEVNSALDAMQATNEHLKDLPSTILQTSADQVAAIKALCDQVLSQLRSEAMDDKPHPDWHGDAYHGVGGSYTYDPKTGKRRLTERTESTEPAEPTGDATPEKE